MATKKKMLQAAAGSATGGAGLDIDEVFSTYLYEGTGSAQAITNGIDLAGEGGLVWVKDRDATQWHSIGDTERGSGKILFTNTTSASQDVPQGFTSFNSNGFTVGANSDTNMSGNDIVSWTFRKAPKFFDVVTWTGDGTAGRTVSHNLGTTVGSIFVKRTNDSGHWYVYHRSTGSTGHLVLNLTDSFTTFSGGWNDTNPTDTEFTLGNSGYVNANGDTYVAYLFAHNDGDGEFGPDGDADVIKCGSYTGDGTTDGSNKIDVGFEPQWLMIKRTNTSSGWLIMDSIRGMTSGGADPTLSANSGNAEATTWINVTLHPDGFSAIAGEGANGSGSAYIYIAIRRGPLAVPEDADDVFDVYAGNDTSYKIPTGFTTDLVIGANRTGSDKFIGSRLTGLKAMRTNTTQAEGSGQPFPTDAWTHNDGVKPGFFASSTAAYWLWKRAPGYFDAVAYTGIGSSPNNVSHNLGVEPEMMWVKGRNYVENWGVYHKDVGATKYLLLNDEIAAATYSSAWNNTAPTSSVFTLGGWNSVNESGYNYIAYLFASAPGVSKVGSYTGNGTSQTIDCGFTSGARFVLIKVASTDDHWHLWDSVRGINAGSEPYLRPNLSSAEISGRDRIDPHSSGFAVDGTDSSNNKNGETYIFYAVA